MRARLTEPYWVAELPSLVADPDAVFAILGDESAGLFFAGPAYADAFHAWLADEAGGSGVAPADLGVASFDDVAPLEDMGWWLVPERRPDPSVDAAAARRWVWALRFWNVATARAFAVALDELETAVGGDVAAAINSGTPIAAGYFQYAYGTEYQTMMAQRGVDAFFGEGFLSYLDNCLAWDLGFYGDWVAGQLEPWGSGASRLRAATYLHAYRGDSGRKMLELAGRGFTWFNHYAYGTFDLSTGDGAGGFGAGSVPWLERVASGSELLAKAEPALAGAAREPSPIVMLGSQSDPVWSDLPAASDDEIGWHMALVQSHYPIDIMPESEIEAGRLEGPAAPKRLLFVLRKHVSKAAFTAIRRWVEAGGTLVLGPDLASHDEYGQLDVERAEWLAVAPGPEHAAAAHQSLQWATDEGLVTFFYDGAWRELVGIGGTTLAVAGDDERPIALRLARARPRGRARRGARRDLSATDAGLRQPAVGAAASVPRCLRRRHARGHGQRAGVGRAGRGAAGVERRRARVAAGRHRSERAGGHRRGVGRRSGRRGADGAGLAGL
ncbi:MAG: hypothetical protein U1F43_14865 [Myxococcota bacterium]